MSDLACYQQLRLELIEALWTLLSRSMQIEIPSRFDVISCTHEDTKPKRNHADYEDLLCISEQLLHSGLDRICLHLHDPSITFHAAERNFLEENVVGLGRDGKVEVVEDRQSFKKRIIAAVRPKMPVPRRRNDGAEVIISQMESPRHAVAVDKRAGRQR
jgi:hypothetical protein